jgi:hypothetical protein
MVHNCGMKTVPPDNPHMWIPSRGAQPFDQVIAVDGGYSTTAKWPFHPAT